MKTHLYRTIRVAAEGPTRQLEADVEYVGLQTIETEPYGSSTAVRTETQWHPQSIEYVTENLTEEEQVILDQKIQEGPYE